MEEMHRVHSGLWFPDNATANGVPGSWEVAQRLHCPSTRRQLVLSDGGAEGEVELGAQLLSVLSKGQMWLMAFHVGDAKQQHLCPDHSPENTLVVWSIIHLKVAATCRAAGGCACPPVNISLSSLPLIHLRRRLLKPSSF